MPKQEGAKGSTIGEADIDLLRKMEPLKGTLFNCNYTEFVRLSV